MTVDLRAWVGIGPLVGTLVTGVTKRIGLFAVQQGVGLDHIVHTARRATHVCTKPESASTPMWAFMPKYRIIAFVTDAGTVRKILDHIGESTQMPIIAPARGPPLWEAAMAAEQAGNDPRWDMSAQPMPEFEFDQRNVW